MLPAPEKCDVDRYLAREISMRTGINVVISLLRMW